MTCHDAVSPFYLITASSVALRDDDYAAIAHADADAATELIYAASRLRLPHKRLPVFTPCQRHFHTLITLPLMPPCRRHDDDMLILLRCHSRCYAADLRYAASAHYYMRRCYVYATPVATRRHK